MLDYRPRKRRRVGPTSDDGLRSSHGTRRSNLAHSTPIRSPNSQSEKESPQSTDSLSVLGTDKERKGRDRSTLAWGELRRRDISTQSDGALDPVLRFAMSQLQGAMVTGWYGNDYNGWPEEDQRSLSSLMFRVWGDMASNQDLTSKLREEQIDTRPSHAEARKVISEPYILNSINTFTVI